MTLATEKIEDLNRWPSDDLHVVVSSGSVAGNLNADEIKNVTVGATTVSMNYFDDVYISGTAGAMAETVSKLGLSGQTVYTTTTHRPDGTLLVTTTNTPPQAQAAMQFKRRWMIEKDQPVIGVRRITIKTTLLSSPSATSQISMVRP